MNIGKKIIAGAGAVAVIGSGYYFSQRSINNLSETRPEMQALTQCAIKKTKVDFVVVDGGRSFEEQIINVRNGKSWTLNSRHLDGAAVDVAAYVNGRVNYDYQYYTEINSAFSACSKKLNIPYVWGGAWKVKDLMHFELDRKMFP